jgi:2-C-methyl-D-erythritol 4-phosphate cytidylyltransferase
VRRGLSRVGAEFPIVAIHDGARPFVSPALIDRCVQAAREQGSVIVGLPARDTIKRVSSERLVETTLPRDSLWEIQTPQVFQREVIVAAHDAAAGSGVVATDDAALVERQGGRVYVLEGERTNFKITYAEDLWLAETMIRQRRIP